MRYQILKVARRFGFDIQRYGAYRDPLVRLRHALDRHHVKTVLDIGANTGQFGQLLRMAGYRDRIISFEPLSAAYAKLQAVARNDPAWTVAPRCAVAATTGTTDIHIAGNSKSSSLLDMTDRHVAGDPNSAYIGSESVDVITLDGFLDHGYATGTALGVKIDTQGSEAQVLAGLIKWSPAVKVIQTEMSLTPLYADGIGFTDLFKLIESRGYRCTSIEPGFTDPKTSEMLQVDATFER